MIIIGMSSRPTSYYV